MVSYFQAGTAWAAAAGNPSGIQQDNACGKKVAVQKATVQVDDIEAKSKKCTAEGKPAIDIQQFQAQSDATTALVGGRVDAMLADSPVIAYAVQQTGGKIEQLGGVYDSAPYGAAVPKADPNFAKAVQGAYQKLIDTGVYKAILDKWGVAVRRHHHVRDQPGEVTVTRRDDAPGRPEPIKAVPVRHPGRWVAVAVIALLLAMLVNSVLTNPNWNWPFQAQWAFSEPVLKGVLTTLWLTVVSMIIGVGLGIVVAVMRLSPNPVLSGVSWVYLWVFRGTPVLVQLFIWANIAALYKSVSLGIPFGQAFFTFDMATLVPNAIAAILGLALNEAAYMAEIVRSGILSVDEGQREAAEALGMSRPLTLRRIVLPQAMRVIVPPTGNETISMLKTTSLVVDRAVLRTGLPGHRHRAADVQPVPDADHGQPLVPGPHQHPDGVPVLHRAALREGRGPHPPADSGAEDQALVPEQEARMTDPSAAGRPPMVLAENVHKSFGPIEVLRGIDMVVDPGQVMCFVGPSGSGKSTFLRCINHLEKIDAGRLSVDGQLVGYRERGNKLHEMREKEVATQRRGIGMVFQRFNLFPHMTALGNVMEAPVKVGKVGKKQARERAMSLLERVGLADKPAAYPAQLSGGQQQRVAIARALAMDPKLMLFDEPTSAPGPRAGRRGARRHARPGRQRDDDDRRHPRDGVRPRGRRPAGVHGQRRRGRVGAAP